MANLSFTTDNQIIRDLYNTAQEAIDASKAMGCDGYRTYLINGETKYVPCSSYILYEKALRYRVVQGKVGAFGSDTFGDKLVGLQLANSKDEIGGDPFFTMGNFSLNRNTQFSAAKQRETQLNINAKSIQNDAVKSFTATSIAERNLSFFSGKPYVETLKGKIDENVSVNILFDKRKLDKHVIFSSLKEGIKNTLVEIYNTFPAAIKLKSVSINSPTVVGYFNYSAENRSSFKVNLYGLSNPFNIQYTVTGTTIGESEIITKYRNFSRTFKNYVVYYNNIEYPIIEAILPESFSDVTNGIQITVLGDPFSGVLNYNKDANISFYIKPKKTIYDEFYHNLSDLSGFLLNIDENTGEYSSEFVFPQISDDGILTNVKETIFFPKYDDINIDLFTSAFDEYTTKLNNLAEDYDRLKTDLISRFLTTDVLKEFDTDERKMKLIFQLYGKTFDNIKKYIDGITFMRNVSYNKIENIPDLLIKNYARMLGHEVFEIEDEDTLIESLFQLNPENLEKGTTPAEIDIEIWRRILINSYYLFKSKGTRKSVEFILKLVGLPDDVFELNEHVYLATRKLDAVSTLNTIYNNTVTDDPLVLINTVPFDLNGYPTTPATVVYQENGGYMFEDKNNLGVFDFGKKYINEYKSINQVKLFDLQRTIDNVKSWVYNETPTDYFRDDVNGYTEFSMDDSRLAINSKEFEVYLSLNRIFDVTLYRQYFRNIIMVNDDLNFGSNLKIDASTLSFNQFLKNSLNNFINPKNRKTIKVYPTLSKIYFDYLKSTNTPIDYTRSLEFFNKFDSSWTKLVQQYVPATTIINAGKKIQNSTFLDNKFVYKHGHNTTTGWLGTDGSEFQQAALKPVYLGKNSVIENQGDIKQSLTGDVTGLSVTGNPSTKVSGLDPTINEYFGVYYTMEDFCDDSSGIFYDWESGINYGDDTTFNGNINQTTYLTGLPRYGVFAIYENKLYRLNTRFIFYPSSLPQIDTAGLGSTATTILPPNIATKTNSLSITKLIWDYIPFDTDARVITFSDTLDLPISETERAFYLSSISKAFAYIQMGISFDCPPPKPHVCYYDFDGQALNLSPSAQKTYVDETGELLTLKQPKFYGYSRDYTGLRPTDVVYGTTFNWAVPYKKRFAWINGKTYYKGEIIADIHATNKENLVASSKVFIVTGDTVTGTSSYPAGSGSGLEQIATAEATDITTGATIDSTTITDTTAGGMFGRYEDRERSDPFMHIDTVFNGKYDVDPNNEYHTLNLTKMLNLFSVFSGATPSTTYRVNNNVIDNQLFISDSISLNFDGFYPIDKNKVGPFYTLFDESTFIHTLNEKVELKPNIDNFISIQLLNSNFITVGDDLTLVTTDPGYYLISRDSFLSFNFQLYFESNLHIKQEVKLKLISSIGYVYDTQTFTFGGDDNADLRQYNFVYNGYFNAGEKIYFVVNPVGSACTLSRYEKITYLHNDPDESDYNALNDPRFRVLFNSGFAGKGHISEGYSIKPIYNVTNFKTVGESYKIGTDKYTDLSELRVEYPTNLSFLFNTLFYPYYKKFNQSTFNFDTTPYDSEINTDKIDFTFTVRSKSSNISSVGSAPFAGTSGSSGSQFNRQLGTISTKTEYTFKYSDYFLGNTTKKVEYNNTNSAISIGKLVGRRKQNHERVFSIIKDINLISSSPIATTETFKGYDDGLKDFTQLDYSDDLVSQLRTYKRYYDGVPGTATFNYYSVENEIYNSEIYKDIIKVVPLFSSQVINYELNDVVKVPIYNYKVVNENTGLVETKTLYKLYVCINDIHIDHCYKVTANGTDVPGEIHPIYCPRGSRSCFIEIEKYNPANFTPWGYEESMINGLANPNSIDYTYRNAINFNPDNLPEYRFGDLIVGLYDGVKEYFKYVYQKPIIYNADTLYQAGDFILNDSAPYSYYFSRQASLNTDHTNATYWTQLTDHLFDHRSLFSNRTPSGGITSAASTSWISLDNFINFSSTAAKLPKTLPVNTDGTPCIETGSRWSNVLQDDSIFVDTSYTFLTEDEVISTNKLLRNLGTTSMLLKYEGTTHGLPSLNNGYYDNDNYYDYNLNIKTDRTNIYLKTGYPTNGINSGYYTYPYIGDSMGNLPLFERLCYESERNNPNIWSTTTGVTYDKTLVYLGSKYAVNRGVLYKFIGDIPLTTTLNGPQPYEDTGNWVEMDFCLVNNFTFYKDRTRISVFESSVESLTTDVKESLFFFKSNLSLKPEFTDRTFTGTTINNQLIGALDKFYDITDPNRLSPQSRGLVDFVLSGSDILMNYYVEKDPLGYPLTGEFMGKLKISDPCGHTATTFLNALFDTDVTKLDRTKGTTLVPVVVPQNLTTQPYVVRVIVKQSGNSNANVDITTQDINLISSTNSSIINRNSSFDKKFNVVPETQFTFKITYRTDFSQSSFGSALINSNQIFVNDSTISTNTVSTMIEKTSNTETRTIILKNVSANTTIFFNLNGIDVVTNEILNGASAFDVNNISIDKLLP